jgi:hypothetical protein
MTGRGLTRHPAFWIGMAALGVVAVLYALRTFPLAFPIVSIELEMDREAALADARDLAATHGWGPEGFRQAASFGDARPEVRTYLELELGEEDAVRRLERDGGYHPFHWRVRHFQADETTEVRVRFTPAGAPYGFRLQLPEDEPGADLEEEQARPIAEAGATEHWGVDLGLYELIEASQETRPGGRVDHAFTYRKAGVELGEGEYRVRLGVAGDRISEVTRIVHVPEGFSRRYQEMRSANVRLAMIASAAFVVLFLIGGCMVGSLLLLRSGWLTWRTPLVLGAVVAGLMALNIPNGLPTAWMGYDTAVPPGLFLAEQAGLTLGALLLGTLFLGLVFMGGESLGRRAFPAHPRLWGIWSPGVANSRPILGQTLAGYLVAAVSLAFVVGFYRVVGAREGWWIPSDALIQPDLLASYLPWLSAVSLALFSGLWEESLFRAVPIAAAALLGRRYGRPGLWIAAALLLQAVIFAAAHADYPQQPAYARLVELTVPALAWGLLYLWLGLLPVVISHATYNLTWMSLPLFVSQAPGIWIDRTIVVAAGLLPLAVVLLWVSRRGLRSELPEGGYNRGWTPPERDEPPRVEERPGEPAAPAHREEAPSGKGTWAFAAAAVLGALLWLSTAPFSSHAPSLDLDRAGAEVRAQELLSERGLEPPEGWRTLSWVDAGLLAPHRFVWETGGEDAFLALVESYLRAPHWHVRFAGFEGPVEERAEEMEMEVGPGERADLFRHRLPEAREGARLDETEARRLAHGELAGRLDLDPDLLREVSAEQISRPERLDWSFTFADTVAYPLERGEARIRVGVAGDAVTERTRFVHVPEDWTREQSARNTRNLILGFLSGGFLLLLMAGSAVAGGVRWARGGFHLRAGAVLAAAAAVLLLVSQWNGMPGATARFSTDQSFGDQLLILFIGLGIVTVVIAAVIGLAGGFIHGWMAPGPGTVRRSLLAGTGLGLLAGGLGAAASLVFPAQRPIWPEFGAVGARVPVLEAALGPVLSFLTGVIVLLVILTAAARWSGAGRRGGFAVGAALVVAGFLLPRAAPGPELWPWVLTGLAVGVGLLAVHLLVRRIGIAFVPALLATILVLDRIQEASFSAYPGAVPGELLAGAILACAAWIWTRALLTAGVGRDLSRP